MTYEKVDREISQLLEDLYDAENKRESLMFQENKLTSTYSISKDTTTEFANKFDSESETCLEIGQELVRTPSKIDGYKTISSKTNITHGAVERTMTDVGRNFIHVSNIAQVKQVTLPNFQEHLFQKYDENDTDEVLKDNDYNQKDSTEDIKASNLGKTVIHYQQSKTQKAKNTNGTVVQYKVHTDQTPSTSQQSPISSKINEGVLCYSNHDQTEEAPTHSIHRNQETVPSGSSVGKTSKSSTTCGKCGIPRASKLSLQRHMATFHGIGKFKCIHCPCIFAFLGDMRSHHMSFHPLGYFVCCVCSKEFTQLKHFVHHKKHDHRLVLSEHSCGICLENNFLIAKYAEICNKH